jgi:hypothetical protein
MTKDSKNSSDTKSGVSKQQGQGKDTSTKSGSDIKKSK